MFVHVLKLYSNHKILRLHILGERTLLHLFLNFLSIPVLPLAPYEAPSLVMPPVLSSSPGVYRVIVSNASQEVVSGTSAVLHPTSFVFRILHVGSHIVGFIWLVRTCMYILYVCQRGVTQTLSLTGILYVCHWDGSLSLRTLTCIICALYYTFSM